MKFFPIVVFWFLSCFIACSNDKVASGSTSETTNAENPDQTTIDSLQVAFQWQTKAEETIALEFVIESKIEIANLENWQLTVISKTGRRTFTLADTKVHKCNIDTLALEEEIKVAVEIEFEYEKSLFRAEATFKIPTTSENSHLSSSSSPELSSSVIEILERKVLGTTWRVGVYSLDNDVYYTSCSGTVANEFNSTQCDTLAGTQPCDDSLPILCTTAENPLRPGYSISPQGLEGFDLAYSQGWSGHTFNLTDSVQGSTMTSREMANAFCQEKYGPDSKMAEYHMGNYHPEMSLTNVIDEEWATLETELQQGGWGFWFYLDENITPEFYNNLYSQRFWVAMDSQKANCWD